MESEQYIAIFVKFGLGGDRRRRAVHGFMRLGCAEIRDDVQWVHEFGLRRNRRQRAVDSHAGRRPERSDLVFAGEAATVKFNASDCILFQKKQRIEWLHQNIVFLLTSIGDLPRDADKLEDRITKAANQLKLLFQNYQDFHEEDCELEDFTFEIGLIGEKPKPISSRLNPEISGRPAEDNSKKFCQDLEDLILETELIREEAMQTIKNRKYPISSRRVGDGNDTIVVGIEEDLLEIKSRLLGCGGSSELQIIPIVGMGGIGKTTLARHAYNDPSNVHHFDVRAWLTISQSYNLWRILHSLWSSIKHAGEEELLKGGKCLFLTEDRLKEHVYRYLKGRRYLIVMDDIWDTNVWDDLRMAFPDDCNGSRLIITTRELNVASYLDTLITQPHRMRLMSVAQSWSLLKAMVFGQEDYPPGLQETGELIAQKCRGLPLSIVVMAGVLSKLNQIKGSWEETATDVSKAVNTSDDDQHFYDILSLSYMHLPHQLRPCFLYTGSFPEDYEINASKLISLWGAEGFLISNETKDIEELGYEYLEDLANRNLVLINKKRYDGKIRTVKIHDLLRDLSLRKAKEGNFLCTITEFSGTFPQGIENSNRLSILCNIYGGFIPDMESSSIHSILLFQHWSFHFLIKLRLLRVLDGLSVHISSRSVTGIGELIHLRYLALTCEASGNTLQLVSESLNQLHNLQTLVVRVIPQPIFHLHSASGDQTEVVSDLYETHLNIEIWRMPQLRLLVLVDGFLHDPFVDTFQVSVSSLENLHTLSRIKDFKCSERMLEMIPNLKKLGIIYSYKSTYETGWSEYGLNNLVHLQRLEKLSLYAEPYPNLKNDLSHNIAFPVTLKKLVLSGCSFPWEEMQMIGSLPNLQVLKLKRRACSGTKWETTEDEFCQLKVLLIDSTDLHQWIIESSSFPVLERLTLYECNSLREIPNGIGDIPTLELIEVDIRNISVVESAKCIEEEQRSVGNDQLQIRFLKSRSWPIITSR